MRSKLVGGYRPGTRTYARPSHQHALHLRWLPDELITQIRQVAKRRNMTLSGFVVSSIKRHLEGGAVEQPLGLCPVCKRRRAAISPHAAGQEEVKVKAKEVKEKAKPEPEAAPQATTCKDGLRYHPGCSTLSGHHNHGPWWPRENCNDPDCAKRTQGWKLAEINAAKRRRLEESGSGSGGD